MGVRRTIPGAANADDLWPRFTQWRSRGGTDRTLPDLDVDKQQEEQLDLSPNLRKRILRLQRRAAELLVNSTRKNITTAISFESLSASKAPHANLLLFKEHFDSGLFKVPSTLSRSSKDMTSFH